MKRYENIPYVAFASPAQREAYERLGYNRTMNVHPWLDDLREMTKMLSGETELLHVIERPIRFNSSGRVEVEYVSQGCKDCDQALELRIKYEHELLPEEMIK